MSNLCRFTARRSSAFGLRALAFLLAVFFWASIADAQVINPTTVSFLPSPDNSAVDSNGQPVVTSYSLAIYTVGASQPYTVLNLGKPAPGSDGYITANFASLLSSPPLPGQTLEGRVAAVGAGGTGDSTWSNTFMFDKAPTAQLTSPASGATFTAPASISVTASASDSDGTISRVDFYANNNPIGSASASPYAITWSNVAAGSYTLSAVATDNGGLKTESATVSITVKAGTNAPPSVQLTSPASGSTYVAPASISLAANASDSGGTITSVAFYANGTLIGSASASPYATTWSNVAAGSYTLTAVATDNGGLKTTSAAVSITVQTPTTPSSDAPPTVQVTSPVSGSMIATGTAVTIAASASDTDGSISRVDFYVNGARVGGASASPYSTLWTPTSIGNYTITAIATDNAGLRTTSAAVSVKVRKKVVHTTAAISNDSRRVRPLLADERGSAMPKW